MFINCGIIGLGYWGPKILRVLKNLEKTENIKVKYICDVSDKILEQYKNEYICTTNYFDILNDSTINMVFIITPISTHFKIIYDSLNYKKNVFVEKPLCKTIDEFKKLYELAEMNEVKLFCDYTFTYSDKINKLKDIININKDNVLFIEMNRENFGNVTKDTVIYDLLPHDLSILLHTFNENISITHTENVYHNDLLIKSNINFNIDNTNIKGIINLSWLNETKNRKIKIFTTNKIINYDDTSDYINVHDYIIKHNDNLIEQNLLENNIIENLNLNEPLKESILNCIEMIRTNNDNIYKKNKMYSEIITDNCEKILKKKIIC